MNPITLTPFAEITRGARGDIELLERIAKDTQAFILQKGWGWRGLAAGRMTMA